MEILKFPDKRLLTKCKPVTEFSAGLKATLDLMYETMLKANGIGLAANQVGLDLRMFVTISYSGHRINVINPEITSFSNEISKIKEGCLSSPDTFLVTGNRHSYVWVKYQDENGTMKYDGLQGIDAIIFQHELGHLNGEAFFQANTVPTKLKKKLEKKWGLR